MIIDKSTSELHENVVMFQLINEIKAQLPLINISSTDDIYHFNFENDIDIELFNQIISDHVPDESSFYNNFGKLDINLLYDTFYDTIEVNSMGFVTCYSYNALIQATGKYRMQINYKYAYSHSIRNISIMILLNNKVLIDLIETKGLLNSLFVPNNVIRMIDLEKGNNKFDIKISCSNIDDIAYIKDIVFEIYRL